MYCWSCVLKACGGGDEFPALIILLLEGEGSDAISLIDPNSYLLHAAEFTVTYGRAEASEPRVIVYENNTTVDGLRVPTTAAYYRKADGSSLATREVRNWSFSASFDESRMVMHSGAVLDTSSPTPEGDAPQ